MKKSILIGLLLVIYVTVATSCTKIKKEKETLQLQKDSLETVVSAKDSIISHQGQEIDEYIGLILEIQQTLEQIKIKNGELTAESIEHNGVINAASKEQLKNEINNIYSMLNKSKEQVNSLRSQLNKSNVEVKNLQALISNLEEQITAKDTEISELRTTIEKQVGQIAGLEENIKSLESTISTRNETIGNLENNLNTAWYIVANRQTLREQGVTDRKGRVLEGKNENFTKIDITKFNEIDLNTGKITILSAHPASSYQIETEGKIVKKLVITDPQSFWSLERRLVIQVK